MIRLLSPGRLLARKRLSSTSASKPARARFAPSPTGMLHLGGLRTALFNYLLAKQTNGQFILRIEDTDQARTIPGATEALLQILKWCGIPYDEGPDRPGSFGPYIQSQRSEIYQDHARILLEKGHAYRCFCSPEKLARSREQAIAAKKPPQYDGTCRYLTPAEIQQKLDAGMPHTVRLKVPHAEKFISFNDQAHGRIQIASRQVDDSILLKSDGLPTYHLANVVDDKLMKVTHVLRGEEWIPSTPKHILLYKAFGWEPPAFAHLPLLINKDGSKLSKRQNDVHVEQLRDKGYLPEALLNFVAFLGWGPGTKKEFYTLEELCRDFDLANINKSPAVVTYDKLDHLNKQHILARLADADKRRGLVEEIRVLVTKEYSAEMQDPLKTRLVRQPSEESDYLTQVVVAVKERVRHLPDFVQLCKPFFLEPALVSDDSTKTAWRKKMDNKIFGSATKSVRQQLATVDETDWSLDTIKSSVLGVEQELGLTHIQLMQPLRYALTGSKVGIDMLTTIHLLGKPVVLRRLDECVAREV
ncbi:glutamyl-tRNA synthetase [Polychytrium aggregatum]|uniref:glutamyl-tRNA synthetase n=1 Tax=Polychytrium aggregatum TaxID=110093 RepID=UPI0022FF247C|nr:glutamyl-tRNA synthetase [Polychytrium aggregatum]KAI9209081.1 glutamyl-tRNA synthetase [Polychytrium aggregatum]